MADYVFGILALALFLNTLGAVVAVFREKRDIASIWAWMIVLILLPFIGFILFFLIGSRISNKRVYRLRTQEQLGLDQIAENQREVLAKDMQALAIPPVGTELVNLFLANSESVLTRGNAVQMYINGPEKFQALFDAIDRAQHHIHLEYFTIYHDQIGQQLVAHLTKRAQAGVQVRVIFDQFGSKGRHQKLYEPLVAAGGEVVPFLSRQFQLLALRMNFRNHRKIAIIDGHTGFIGGLNVGDQYLNRNPRFGYWRDTHLKIQGDAVLSLQSRFIMDWNATAQTEQLLTQTRQYFPSQTQAGGQAMVQIVASGPDESKTQIKQGFLRMFATAQTSITIQTPYFIPDQAILETLETAILSGIEVNLMIPDQPDHPLVYRATEYYAWQLLEAGARVFRYDKGFLHSKVVVVDHQIATTGSANMDIRSFALNFEANAFIYDSQVALALEEQFVRDAEESTELTLHYFESQSAWRHFKQKFARLFSPLL
jgi:cardiolipin synthase